MTTSKKSLVAGVSAALIVFALAVVIAKPFETTATGSIKATVIDSATGNELRRASVQVIETKQGAYTKDNGVAIIINLKPGTYTVVAKYAGFKPQTFSAVRIDSGRTTELSFKLRANGQDSLIVQQSRLVNDKSRTLADRTKGGYSVQGARGAQNSMTLGSASAPLATSEVNVASAGGDASHGGYIGGQINSAYTSTQPFTNSKKRSAGLSGFASFESTPAPTQEYNTAEYTNFKENEFKEVSQEPLSTFSIDVDGASYSNIRHFIMGGMMPPKDAVRIEEMINYFKYAYEQPSGSDPFSINTETGECPWKPSHKLVLVGLQGKEIAKDQAPPANLTFLLDVSGSMQPEDRLPLIRKAFHLLIDELRPQDRVAIVAYAGAAGLVLEPTTGAHKDLIFQALDRLGAGGSTAGGQGIQLAYDIAKRHFDKSFNNRVILATDGDFNVGISNTGDLTRYIEEQRASGIYLTTIGVGSDNYKDARLKELADKGNGNYYYLDNLLEAKKVFVTQMGGTLNAIAKDVKIQVEFNPAYVAAYRLVGYESRILAKEDFNNDKKDAGELGSGHTVTALYEIIPPGVALDEISSVDSLRYQPNSRTNHAVANGEMMMVKFRYKRPTDTTSLLIQHAVLAHPDPYDAVDTRVRVPSLSNLEWATAVSEFGMVLRDSKFKGTASLSDVLKRARTAKGIDAEGYRAEFIKLVEMAQLLDKASK